MWRLIFLFLTILNILGMIYPFLVKIDLKFNLIKLKGSFKLIIFNKIKFEFKLRIKNGYVYLYFKNKEIKEKISNKNINFLFIMNLIKQQYFRQQLLNLEMKSNFGYNLDSSVTASMCGFVDVLTKSIFAKIKNNKKTAHIFIKTEPQYNEDVFNLRLIYEFRVSMVDLIYAFIYTNIYIWRNYEKNRTSKLIKKQ